MNAIPDGLVRLERARRGQLPRPCFERVRTSRSAKFRPSAAPQRAAKSQREPSLKPWQEEQLRAALSKGRKNVEINQLCQQTQLERRRVLDWLKNPPAATTDPRDIQAQQPWASSEGRAEDPIIVPQTDRWSGREQVSIFHTQRGARKFNKAVLSTLETVFEHNQKPDEEVIYSIVDLHHVPKRQVVDWFADKRRQSRREAGLPVRPPRPKMDR